MARVGIDFGTSNSSVMCLVNDEIVSLLRRGDGTTETPDNFIPTEIHLKRDGNFSFGWNISNKIRQNSPKELIRNLKEKLMDDTFDEKILGYDKWMLFQKFMEYLINNANKSPYMAHDRITEVVLSFPFNVSTLYITKMKEYTEAIEYRDYNDELYSLKVFGLQEEPVAISLNYFADNVSNKKSTVLICDIGGGTTDISVVQDNYGAKKVLGHTGMRKAGNYMDKLVLEYLLNKTDTSCDEFMSSENRSLNKTLFDIRSIKEDVENDEELPVELYFGIENILEYDFSVEEYHKVIKPFVEDIIRNCKALIEKNPVDAIVLAGGCARCRKIETMFKEAFTSIKVVSNVVDKRTATAVGNVEKFNVPASVAGLNDEDIYGKTIENILNYSYGTDCVDENGVDKIRIFFHKDEPLPIVDRCIRFCTRAETSCVRYSFYLGNDVEIHKENEYDFNKYQLLAGKVFEYNFGRRVPKHTRLETYFSMDENGIMTIRVESDKAINSVQSKTITFLE